MIFQVIDAMQLEFHSLQRAADGVLCASGSAQINTLHALFVCCRLGVWVSKPVLRLVEINQCQYVEYCNNLKSTLCSGTENPP